MKKIDISRAWKDPLYRLSLSEEELSALPENPAGIMEVEDSDLIGVAGGAENTTIIPITLTVTALTYYYTCNPPTWTRICF